MRKPIQVFQTASLGPSYFDNKTNEDGSSILCKNNENIRTIILCDDGSIFQHTNFGKKWKRLPDIPQD